MTFPLNEYYKNFLKSFMPIMAIILSLLIVFEVFYSKILKYQKEFSVSTINSIFQDYSKGLNPYLLSQSIEILEKAGPIKCTKIFSDSGKIFLDLGFKSWCNTKFEGNNFFRSSLKSVNDSNIIVEFKLQIPLWFGLLIHFIRALVLVILILYGRWILKNIKRELFIKERERNLLNEKIKIGRQIAHDIRSPLVALEMALNHNSIAVDSTLFQNAIRRIHNMADGLLYEKPMENIFPLCIADLVRSAVYEKEFNASKMGIKICFKYLPMHLKLYSQVERYGFLRMLSNILNNAIEALHAVEIEDKVIVINLTKVNENLELTIKDNGCGIPQNTLRDILQKGGTYNKKKGVGLGLNHAREYIHKMNGQFNIKSNVQSGTEVTLSFSSCPVPSCLVERIKCFNGQQIVLIDDDPSLWPLMKQKLNNENIQYFKNFDEIGDIRIIKNADLVFVDFDMSKEGQWKNGIEFIKFYQIENKSILFSGSSDGQMLLDSCVQNNIKLLEKSHLCHVEIQSIENSTSKIKIVIDDDHLLKLSINSSKKGAICFSSVDEFLKSEFNSPDNVDKILIDSELGPDKGENQAQYLFCSGYKDIYLYTGHAKENFNLGNMPWIKDVISKSETIFNVI